MDNLTFDQLPHAISQLSIRLQNVERILLENWEDPKQVSEELLTVDQCAKFLNLSKPTIYGLISKGELPVLKKSKRCYFLKSEIIGYLKEGRRKTTLEAKKEAHIHCSKTRY